LAVDSGVDIVSGRVDITQAAKSSNGQRPPRNLGKYPVLGQLGKGAMGVVYKSFDPVIRRPVALKTIRKELLDDAEEASNFGKRFRNEAQAAGRLLHPGIVAVYEYGEDEHYAFIAMEYVEGRSLRQYFESHVRFAEDDLVSVMAQLLEALHYAHEQGVWHRDIKPANIIIMSNGHVKVADFGIARVESSTLTQVGVVMGTPGFIAPEQYLGRDIDHRVDVFAAGVVLYELLAGHPPFSGSKESVMYKVCHEAPEPPSLAAGNPLYARFDPVVLRALAKRAEDRYGSAAQFRADLLEAHDRPVSATVSQQTLIRGAVGGGLAREAAMPRGGERAPPRAPETPGRAHVSTTMPTEMLAAAGWNVAELAAVERSLTRFVGPIARIMVRRTAPDVSDLAALVQKLADQLTSGADRTRFIQENALVARTGSSRAHPPAVDNDATVVPGAAPTAPPGPTPEEIARAARLLAVHVGPIAPLLVRQAAQAGVGRSAFLDRITERLGEAERERFLHNFEHPR
jgi:tRNA A-37 threonylcarbamoyl transferase component Bud32